VCVTIHLDSSVIDYMEKSTQLAFEKYTFSKASCTLTGRYISWEIQKSRHTSQFQFFNTLLRHTATDVCLDFSISQEIEKSRHTSVAVCRSSVLQLSVTKACALLVWRRISQKSAVQCNWLNEKSKQLAFEKTYKKVRNQGIYASQK